MYQKVTAGARRIAEQGGATSHVGPSLPGVTSSGPGQNHVDLPAPPGVDDLRTCQKKHYCECVVRDYVTNFFFP